MSKFKKYLNENIMSVDDFNNILHTKCKSYLKLIKPYKTPLIRGMYMDDKEIGIKQVRTDRMPSGTNEKTFKLLNKWLQKNGHNRRDNSFMVSSKRVNSFGDSFGVFPIGKFSYTWVEAADLNTPDERTNWESDTVDDYDYANDVWHKGYHPRYRLRKPFKDYFHTDKGINEAIKNEFEIWINCKEYLYLRMDSSKYGWHSKNQKVILYE